MTDLNQLLTEAFDRRAAAAPDSLSTDAVRRAIRRSRHRAVRLTAALTLATIATGAGAIGLTVSMHHRSSDIGGDQGWNDAVGSFTPVVQLPPVGQPLVSVVRIVAKKPPSTYYELCSGHECDAGVDLAGKAVTEQGKGGSVFGLAPSGTAKVLVSIAGAAYREAALAVIPSPGRPMLYAVPGASLNVGPSAAVTRTVRTLAIDASGKVMSAVEVLGSQELAQRHPVSGPTVPLPAGAADDIGVLAWMSADGWSCEGNRVVVDGHLVFGASECQRPRTATEMTLVATGQSLGPGGAGTILSWQVFRAPSTVRKLVWQLPAGLAVPATVRATTHGVLAVLVVKGKDVSSLRATLTGTDATGAVVVTAKEAQLLNSPARPIPAQVSGQQAPIQVSAP